MRMGPRQGQGANVCGEAYEKRAEKASCDKKPSREASAGERMWPNIPFRQPAPTCDKKRIPQGWSSATEGNEMGLSLIPDELRTKYTFEERDHACAILATDYPAEFADLLDCLTA